MADSEEEGETVAAVADSGEAVADSGEGGSQFAYP